MKTDPVPFVSIVIPVYNGASSIEGVVRDIQEKLSSLYQLEVILVNDGSLDKSAEVCQKIVGQSPLTVQFVNLSRNFGEHNAVLAGISYARGDIMAILDDDGQNPPAEIPRLVAKVLEGYDVAYGYYREKKHHFLRNWGSRFNDRVASWLIGKPQDLYLSSFKALNRFVADYLKDHLIPNPYIDSMIFQCTQNVTQVQVEHEKRVEGSSNYNLRRLIRLWLNMLTTASIQPLRLSTYAGLVFAVIALLGALAILVEYLFFDIPVSGWASISMAICLFSAIQLLALGMIGEYMGRVFQSGHRTPFVVREIFTSDSQKQ